MKFALNVPEKGLITSTGYPVEVFFWIFKRSRDKGNGLRVHSNNPILVEKQLQKYKFLSYELGEYDRKRAYQFSNEPKGSEVDSWKRALEQFAGKREVFGNEMDHGT